MLGRLWVFVCVVCCVCLCLDDIVEGDFEGVGQLERLLNGVDDFLANLKGQVSIHFRLRHICSFRLRHNAL